MSKTDQLEKVGEGKIDMLDKSGNSIGEMVSKTVNSFSLVLNLGREIQQMRQMLLLPKNMELIKSLMGTSVGFRTDRDESGKRPYTDEEIADAVVEARAMGIYPIFGHMDMICGRAYCKGPGFRFLLRSVEGLTSYSIIPNIPVMKNGGAISSVSLSWTYQKKDYHQTIEFAIKVNTGMGADAINGKAERKALKWLYTRLTQIDIAEGDIDDVVIKPNNEVPSTEDMKTADVFDKWANGVLDSDETSIIKTGEN